MESIKKLLDLMAALREPRTGCPWDLQQSFETIAPYTIEEAYEVADAIDRGDLDALRDELGDLLFQVLFHARLAEEQEAFDFDDVAKSLYEKMHRRHPHVFGNEEQRRAGQQQGSWERIKAAERATRDSGDSTDSALDGVALALPALKRAAKLGKRAAATGFDWPDDQGVLDKIDEELAELEAARDGELPAAVDEELGDLLFSVVNLARHLGLDPERSLSKANAKFEARFRLMESNLRAAGKRLDTLTIDELESAWQQAKAQL